MTRTRPRPLHVRCNRRRVSTRRYRPAESSPECAAPIPRCQSARVWPARSAPPRSRGPPPAPEVRKTGWPPGLPRDRRPPAPNHIQGAVSPRRGRNRGGDGGLHRVRGWRERHREPPRLSPGVGDGFQPHHPPGALPAGSPAAAHLRRVWLWSVERPLLALRRVLGGAAMSRQAIAAGLARADLPSGERLVAFSLASFADRENRARPGTPAAAGRAGLKRSWFLGAREGLERRGLVVVERAATGRGRASTLWLAFAETGPWWEGEINAELFEAVLSYSRAQGSARLLLAAAAALADEERLVEGFTTRQLCAAAKVTDTTYRRARVALLASGELVLRRGTGGRGN